MILRKEINSDNFYVIRAINQQKLGQRLKVFPESSFNWKFLYVGSVIIIYSFIRYAPNGPTRPCPSYCSINQGLIIFILTLAPWESFFRKFLCSTTEWSEANSEFQTEHSQKWLLGHELRIFYQFFLWMFITLVVFHF